MVSHTISWKQFVGTNRNSYWSCSVKRSVLKFSKIHWKTPVLESLFNKVADIRPATVLKKRLQHKCFPVNFAKFLRTNFSQNTSGRLLLYGIGLSQIFKLPSISNEKPSISIEISSILFENLRFRSKY